MINDVISGNCKPTRLFINGKEMHQFIEVTHLLLNHQFAYSYSVTGILL